MNMHTPIGNQNDSQNLPGLPIDIDQICEGRNQSIAHWLSAYDSFHEHTTAAAKASFGGNVGLSIPHGHTYEDSKMARAFIAKGETEVFDSEKRGYVKIDARDEFERLITIDIDRANWRHLLDHCGFDALLDRQAREEFEDGLRGTPPVFNAENCTATFGDIYSNRREYFLRGIANTFMALDRRFRSHDGFKIGGRLIIERAMSEWGGWDSYNRRDTLYDVERIFCELDDRAVLTGSASIVDQVEKRARRGGLPDVVHGDYFRVRVFKNGNLHIWFERKDLLEEVNKLLAEFYGEVIGDGYNETEADETPQYHLTPAKGWGAFMSSEAVADKVMMHARTHGLRVLEPSAGTGVLAKAARNGGASEVVCVEIQSGMAYELIEQGFDTLKANFLELEPSDIGMFDTVLMNPPFDRGRDCDHVRHAWKFLKPGGCLVAVMSARAEFGTDKRHKALHDMLDKEAEQIGYYGRGIWHDLPAGSFAHAGTNVNTVILAVTKKES